MVIAPFDLEHLDRLVDCVTQVTVSTNVIAQALGVTEQDYRPYAWHVCERALSDRMGLMLREPATDRIVGFHGAADLVDVMADEQQLHRWSPRIRRWAAFSRIVVRWYLDRFHRRRSLERGEVFTITIGGTTSDYFGQRFVGRMILKSSMEFGLARGFRRVLGVATHPNSVRHTRMAAIGAHLWELPFAGLDDPDLARITEPPYALVSVTPLHGTIPPR